MIFQKQRNDGGSLPKRAVVGPRVKVTSRKGHIKFGLGLLEAEVEFVASNSTVTALGANTIIYTGKVTQII